MQLPSVSPADALIGAAIHRFLTPFFLDTAFPHRENCRRTLLLATTQNHLFPLHLHFYIVNCG